MLETLKTLIKQHINIWVAEDDTPTATSINCGYCVEFRDGVFTNFKNHPELAGISFETIDGCDLDLHKYKDFYPVGLTEDELFSTKGIVPRLCHGWIVFEGKHFDSEVPDGIEDPFSIPCLRRAMVEILSKTNPEKLEKLAQHAWWNESLQMTSKFLEWYSAFYRTEDFNDEKTVIDAILLKKAAIEEPPNQKNDFS